LQRCLTSSALAFRTFPGFQTQRHRSESLELKARFLAADYVAAFAAAQHAEPLLGALAAGIRLPKRRPSLNSLHDSNFIPHSSAALRLPGFTGYLY
jgi:hypothetical protein